LASLFVKHTQPERENQLSLDRAEAPNPYDILPSLPAFTLESDDVEGDKGLDVVFRHTSIGGENSSPALRWSGFPEETRGFALTAYDPDAPTGSGFWHWVVVGLPASVTELARGAGASDATLPGGAFHVRNDFGSLDYGGAAPPAGDRTHRYFFAVHALDTDDLGLDSSASPAYVGFNLTFHTIARAVLVPTHQEL
jgi:Raf kinase inhibitor-like YbhB/YbcL family protein